MSALRNLRARGLESTTQLTLSSSLHYTIYYSTQSEYGQPLLKLLMRATKIQNRPKMGVRTHFFATDEGPTSKQKLSR